MIAALAAVIIVSAISFYAGKASRDWMRSRTPGKEPMSIIWYAMIVFIAVYCIVLPMTWLYPEYGMRLDFIDVETLAALLFAASLFYPIGYSFGRVQIQNYTLISFEESGEYIDPESFVYYYIKRKGRTYACFREETMWYTIKMIFGYHNLLEFPFGNITNTHKRRKKGKVKDDRCVTVRKIERIPIRVKRFGIPAKVHYYKFIVGGRNTVTPEQAALSAEAWIEATEFAEALNIDLEALRIEKETARIKGGINAIKRLRRFRMDSDIVDAVNNDIREENERRRKTEEAHAAEAAAEMTGSTHIDARGDENGK